MRTNPPPDRAHQGFTLTEMMIAVALSAIVGVAVITAFVWCMQQFMICSKIAWSQDEAMRSSNKLSAYMRNAKDVVSMDTNSGRWVQLRMSDNTLTRLVYSNAITSVRDGRMYLIKTNGTETIIARGLTEIMTSSGFTTPIFTRTSTNALRVSYRVAEPVAGGGRAANDADFAATITYAAYLRNVPVNR